MNSERISCAVWPWGLERKDQMVQALKDIAEIGYKTFESVKYAIDVFGGNAEEFRSVVEEYGVRPVSFYFHMTGSDREDIDELQSKLEFLAKLEVKRMSLQATGISGRKPDREELSRLLASIESIGKIAKNFGVVPCIHPHHNTMIMYEDEIDFIMQNTDPEYIAFGPDTAHLTVGLCDAAVIMERYGDRIRFLHLKDYRKGTSVGSVGIRQEGVEVYENFCELGTGSVDFKRVFQVLRESGYDGYMCTELDISRIGNKASAEVNYRYVEENFRPALTGIKTV